MDLKLLETFGLPLNGTLFDKTCSKVQNEKTGGNIV